MSTIRFDDVSKSFGSVTAVKGCCLDVEDGAFVAILGPSGCGKTTMLRMLGGFLTPDRGRLLVDGNDITKLPPFRRNIGVVFQNYALFPHLTIGDNVGFGLKMRGLSSAAIKSHTRRYLELVKLGDTWGRFPSELSGGQQQRIALARALAIEPGVLLLDEPLSALDRKLREHMQGELKLLQRRIGVTTILVTHDQEEALTMADKVVVMSAGTIKQIGSPEDIYERPRTRFVAEFVGLSNILRGRLTATGRAPRFETTSGHVFDVAADEIRDVGATPCLLIRPERIQIHRTRPAGDHPNVIEATVNNVLYQGQQTRIEVIAGQMSLTAVAPAGESVASLESLDRAVYLSMKPQDLYFLEGDDDPLNQAFH